MIDSIYNWDRRFARGRFSLYKGLDYHCQQSSMTQQIRNAASKRGLRISLIPDGDEIRVIVTGKISDGLKRGRPRKEYKTAPVPGLWD